MKTKDNIKIPYPYPVSDNQRSKNIGYIMGYRAAKAECYINDEEIKEIIETQKKDGHAYVTQCNSKWYEYKFIIKCIKAVLLNRQS